jgi:ABC-type glutathione transport system ATPase component
MELLRKVAVREDRAVIVVTHDSRVFDFADRIAYMNDGQIVRNEVREESWRRLQPAESRLVSTRAASVVHPGAETSLGAARTRASATLEVRQ